MGTVYKAEHIHFRELRALKLINAEYAIKAIFVDRFMDEARLTRRLRHPNIVQVHDVEQTEDGHPFIVMEFLKGQVLYDALQAEQRMSVARAATIAKQVAAALHAAHRLDMVHRDIKPANIMLKTPAGEQAKVLDFGIAKVREYAEQSQFNKMDQMSPDQGSGTPAYMSPEQVFGRSGTIDGRSDLYSLGLVMYRMLAGELPFKADATQGWLKAQIEIIPAPIKAACPSLPDAIADLVMACLAKDPARRPQNAVAIIDQIEFWEKCRALTHAHSAERKKQVSSQETVPKRNKASRDGTEPRIPSRKQWVGVLAGTAGVAFLLLLFMPWRIRGPVPNDLAAYEQPKQIASSPTSAPAMLGTGIEQTAQSTTSSTKQVFSAHTQRPMPSPRSSATEGELKAEYDAFTTRLTSVEASLRDRTRERGDLPVKPEVNSAIQTSKLDLLSAHKSLSNGNPNDAAKRLNRVKEALKYLESL